MVANGGPSVAHHPRQNQPNVSEPADQCCWATEWGSAAVGTSTLPSVLSCLLMRGKGEGKGYHASHLLLAAPKGPVKGPADGHGSGRGLKLRGARGWTQGWKHRNTGETKLASDW